MDDNSVRRQSTLALVRAAGNIRTPLPPGCDPESGNRSDKLTTPRNVLIAIIMIMPILILALQSQLILPLQNPLCCGNFVTYRLDLPPAAAQQTSAAILTVAMNDNTAEPTDRAATAAIPAGTQAVAAASSPRESTGPGIVATKPSAAERTQLTARADNAPSAAAAENIGENIRQDAVDALASINRSGYVKIAVTGDELADDADAWACVKDNTNALTWEVKKNDGGIRDRDHSYSWFREFDGVKNGIPDGGRCKGGVDCDTAGYARAMNALRLCGHSDWRLPTKAELETLVQFNGDGRQATINRAYFPEAVPSWYWTASEHPLRDDYAWYILFHNGVALNDLKERPKHIRLVRGEQLR